MNMLRNIIRWTLDVLTVLTAVFLVKVAINWYAQHNRVASAVVNVLKPGSSFSLAVSDSVGDEPTLVMALQSGCPYCEASMSFYRDILRSNTSKVFHVVALFPQAPTEGQAFMRRYLGQDADRLEDVRHVNFDSLGITGTPTLIIMNSGGRIESSWTGQLSPKQENDVFRALGVNRVAAGRLGPPDVGADNNLTSNLITPAEFIALRRQLLGMPIVDIDPRPIFAQDHIAGALNIPVDELEARAVHEVPVASTIVVYCGYCPPCMRPSEKVNSTCWMGSLILRQQGFRSVRFLAASMADLEKQGIRGASVSK